MIASINGYSQTAWVSGAINTPQGAPVAQVTVQTTDGQYSTTSDASGNYTLELPTNASYTLTFEQNLDYKEGVSFRDVATMNKYILGILEYPEPDTWLGIAGDLNNSGGISTFDSVLLLRLIFENLTPDVPSWYFYDGTNTEIQIDNLQADMTDLNMIGIKRGDMDCN